MYVILFRVLTHAVTECLELFSWTRRNLQQKLAFMWPRRITTNTVLRMRLRWR